MLGHGTIPACAPALVLAWAAALCGCHGANLVAPVLPPRDAGCDRTQPPQTYQVYFVTDVSGSMAPFLEKLSAALVTFAGAFSPFDGLGRPVLVDFFLVAFVNDVKSYGGRMTSSIALQAAFDEAIARGATGKNLAHDSPNADTAENLLDAIQAVVDAHPTADARLMMIATDSEFAEAPAVLTLDLPVRSTYAAVLGELRALGVRVHAFVPAELDGLTRDYHDQPALTTLPGSSVHDLDALTQAPEQIADALSRIAQQAGCH